MMRLRKAWVRGVDGLAEHLLGRSLLADHALVEETDPAGHLPGERHLVGGQQHGHALVGQLADDVQDLGDQLRQGVGPLLGLPAGQLQHLARGQGDVLEHGRVREQVEALEDDADVAAVPVERLTTPP
jgi:hypothetical protein